MHWIVSESIWSIICWNMAGAAATPYGNLLNLKRPL